MKPLADAVPAARPALPDHAARPMAEPFKNLIDAALVRSAARHLQRASPHFEARRFERLATTGLESLELKARALRVADALEATLPRDFPTAAEVIEAALAPPEAGERMAGLALGDDGLRGWILWPVGEFVARRGLATPERALGVLHALTQRFTAEFAIRPFLVAYPELTFGMLARWVQDPSPHVRRLVSEGSRPRLPWGIQLKALIADPSPTLPLLRALLDDPSDYVRRSVANHLNDIAKDHPALLVEWLSTYLPNASAERRGLLRHASRTLVKRGDARVLAAWGVGQRFTGRATVTLTPRRVVVGGHLTLTLLLRSTARRTQQLVIDYVVHHRKKDGTLSPKVFKGWSLALAAGGEVRLEKRHSMRAVTTRRYYAGRHLVSIRVNGADVASAPFTLAIPR